MTLRYFFDDDDQYDKDVSTSEISEYLSVLPLDEVAELLKDSFYLLPDEERISILDDFEEPNYACPDFRRWAEEDWDFCVELIMEEETLERLYDELHDFYEADARDEYDEVMSEPTDPYEQRGLSRSDFY